MQCENCGRPKNSAFAECKHCAADLRGIPTFTYDPAVIHIPNEGPYQCAACNKHFEACVDVLMPAKAPWWRYQRNALGCPHCKVALRWIDQFRPSNELRWWQTISTGALMGVFISMATVGKAVIQFWWPGHVGAVTAWLFCTGVAVLLMGELGKSPVRQQPQKPGHFVVATSAKQHPPESATYWLIAMASSIFLLVLPERVAVYVWLLMVLVGVLGGALGGWMNWQARLKAARVS